MASPDTAPVPQGRLRATFRSEDDARAAIERLQAAGVPRDDITVDATDDRQHMLVRQQRSETDSMGSTTVDVLTPAQAKGALRLAAVGAAVGAVVVGALGFVLDLGDLSPLAGGLLFALVGALAGGSAGFVFGGGRQPELDGELRDHSVDTTVALTPRSTELAEAAIRTIDASSAIDSEYETRRGDPLAGDA